ncbi:hypothetical protein CYLTODRAFT_351900 [Cylindrobasidium torrendii FP15055 ss-10]|uniref:Uncharacterized protein n=1 Tax=Cylindrobasidium torrendii FP15055 ss-10 TaxID=1314674 RepID=A0A0D7BC40_9AGAR|nr:hypothetical protein CYLTODRAFT_351900 [Cylindrobasidium torrendii FP15055 ss-10]
MPGAYAPDVAQVPDYMTTQESEKVLRDLMEGAVNSEEVELNPEDYEVPGFSEGFKLLHHQVQARKWMASREDANAKRYGGILADDMGLGKTIQALVRIVEGKAKKRDREDGWSGSTLVVVPLAVMNQWADEARKMTGLKVMTHHGASRTADPDVLRKHHIVVTTYDVLKSEHKAFMPDVKDESKTKSKKKKNDDYSSDEEEVKPKKRAAKVKTAVMEMKWWRVILDEAHTIKNASTQAARACFELKARYRWVLTGTPMQNEVGELFSLFKFLHVKPYHEIERFNVDIAKPFKSGHGMNRALKRLQAVLHAVMLRRRKDTIINGKKLIELPPRELEIVACSFSAEEQRFYDNLANQMDVKLNDMESEGRANYMGVLLLLLRLRQACNHCALVTKDFKDDLSAVEPRPAAKNESQETDADDLANALENLAVTRKCRVCQTDLPSSHDSASITCSRCEEFMNVSEDAGSSKIREMLRILQDIDKQSNGEDKTIIFSQFTSFLDLIEPFFIERGIRWVRYDGSMKPADREIALNRIKTDPKVRIILISFKAGSTGLNLTCCNRVILMDMWWNPALEDQSFDRAHRFGQKKKVNIYKLKVDETVEDRILELQEKKRALAAAALSGDKVKNLKLDMGELLALFRRNGRDDDSDDDEYE